MEPAAHDTRQVYRTEPAAVYTRRIHQFEADCRRLALASRRISRLRVTVFLLLLAVLVAATQRKSSVTTVSASLLALVFLGLVWQHAKLRRQEQWSAGLVQLNRDGLRRMARAWNELPARARSDLESHAYANDLDLFGSASLIQLLGPTPTVVGQTTLDDWLLRPAEPPVIRERQDALRELSQRIDARDVFTLHGRMTRTRDARDLDAFVAWAEGEPWLAKRKALVVLAWSLPLLNWVLLGLQLSGVPNPWWKLTLVMTLLFWLATARSVQRTFRDAFAREAMLAHYPELLRNIGEPEYQAQLLRRIKSAVHTGSLPAWIALRRLERLMQLADMRFSSLHVPLQLLTLSDLHVLNSLERWQTRHGRQVRSWLRSIGEMDALNALATLAHDQPEWSYPEIDAAADCIEARRIGHPLIPPASRVDNDVTVGPAGSVLLITGSNMSGKSTLLRSIGLNAVLAQAGAPVCAQSMRMPPVDPHTSIRVQDSLARGVSYFMAELQRLKSIVDAAAAPPDGRVTLYLLDELLHGTNSGERRIAARLVIHRLVETGALGAVTTHDLELIRDHGSLKSATRPVHFREHFREHDGQTVMQFDYVLRPGVAPTTNALRLVELVGLGPVESLADPSGEDAD